jgi:oligoribonuclease
MCGNSIGQDRRFMVRYMPRWKPGSITATSTSARSRSCASAGSPRSPRASRRNRKHTALADIRESIDELKYYREHFLVKPAV